MSKHRRVLKDGRSATGAFLMLTWSVYDRLDELKISANARAVLLALCRIHNGKNNGEIAYPVRAGAKLGLSQWTTSRALRELTDQGFIAKVRTSAFTTKTRLATEYRLTFYKTASEPATFWTRAEPIAKNNSSASDAAGA